MSCLCWLRYGVDPVDERFDVFVSIVGDFVRGWVVGYDVEGVKLGESGVMEV